MDWSLPVYYVLTPRVKDSLLDYKEPVQRVLAITPINCAIVLDPQDGALAAEFSEYVFKARDFDHAAELATKTFGELSTPALIFGEAELLDAIYPDGRREAVKVYVVAAR